MQLSVPDTDFRSSADVAAGFYSPLVPSSTHAKDSTSCGFEHAMSPHSYAPPTALFENSAQGQIYHNAMRLSIDHGPRSYRMNKIICTIGPASQSVEALKELIKAGMSIARMNFSHGSYEYHETTIQNVRQAASELGREDIAIALDTKGPEIRTGRTASRGDVPIARGSEVVVTTDVAAKDSVTDSLIYCDYAGLGTTVYPGAHIYIDDGSLDLEVVQVRLGGGANCAGLAKDPRTGRFTSGSGPWECVCVSRNDHTISDYKGVNLPYMVVNLPAVSSKDKADLEFGVRMGVDMIFASFIQSAEGVKLVRSTLRDAPGPDGKPGPGKDILIISKIESQSGVARFDEILVETDGIMVARGDLGIEIPTEKVFVAQKMMISRCNLFGKPVICATQMLESMTNNPRPTRAEASDVANAVLDGADCVMLSGETAKGLYPVQCVATMARLCQEAQECLQSHVLSEAVRNNCPIPMPPGDCIAASAVSAAYQTHARALITLSNSGQTARLVAKFQPACPIICATYRKDTARHLSLSRGVIPVMCQSHMHGWEGRDARVSIGVELARELRIVQTGDIVVVVHADAHTTGVANLVRLITVPEPSAKDTDSATAK